MRARLGRSQPPTGWPQPHLSGWAPLIDPGPFPLQAARSVGRWLWPTLAASGFLAVVASTFAHDNPASGLSHRGLLTVALAAVVVVLLTIHRRHGPRRLSRAVAEYTVVALLATLMTVPGVGIGQQPADHPASGQARAQAAAGQDQPAVLRAGAGLIRGLTGAARWLVNLWHRADQQATANREAMPTRPGSPTPSALAIWRSLA